MPSSHRSNLFRFMLRMNGGVAPTVLEKSAYLAPVYPHSNRCTPYTSAHASCGPVLSETAFVRFAVHRQLRYTSGVTLLRVPILQFGQFYGYEVGRREVSGLSISERWRLPSSVSAPEHAHENAHFVIALQGRYKFAGLKRSASSDRQLITYTPPGFSHSDGLQTVGKLLTVTFNRERYEQLGQACRLPAGELCVPLAGLWASATRLRSEMLRADPFASLIIDGLCLEIAGSVLRRSTTKHVDSRLFNRIKEMLHNWPEGVPLNLTALSKQADVTNHETVLSFRRHAHCSPGEYLRRLRLERSRERLLGSRQPLTTIAAEAGYADQSAFTKAFTRFAGCSPGAFRRQHGKQR